MSAFRIEQQSSSNGKPMLVVQGSGASLDDLKHWIAAERPAIEQAWVQQGSLRFRGFQVLGAEAFEQVALALEPDLKNDYPGTAPRNARSRYVFTASEMPPPYPIAQHIEMSFLPNTPRKLFFHCTVPTARDGETPTVDFRAVLRDLDPEVRQAFETRGIRNLLNYDGPATPKGLDPWKLKRWDDMFQSQDKAVVEQKARERGLTCEWQAQDRLRLSNTQAATRKHALTGEPVWFNHLAAFHRDAAALEYAHIRRRQGGVQANLYFLLATTLTAWKRWRGRPEAQALHVTYADGGEIPHAHVRQVLDTIWKHLVIEPWQQGDVLAIDNRSTAHGRLPFKGPREVLVAWTGT